MRVLEGSRVLIKQPKLGSAMQSCGDSTPSTTSSGSPCASSDQPTPPPSHPQPVQADVPSGWADYPTLADLPQSDPAVDTLYDFTGVYYVAPNDVPLNGAVNKPNIYNLPEVTSDSVPLYDPFANANGHTNENSSPHMNETTANSNGPTVISIPEYPTFSSAVANQQQSRVAHPHPHEDVLMQPPTVTHPPQIIGQAAPGVHANGYPVNGGLGTNGMSNDQASWEQFLRELGVTT